MIRTLATALFALALTHTARADDAPKPTSVAEQMQGTWLFDEAALKKRSELGRVWESVVTVTGDSFTMSKVMGAKNDLKGTLVFDPKTPGNVDLKLAELDLSELLEGYKLPAGTLAGRYKVDGDRLTLCFPIKYEGTRPTEFVANGDQYLVTLARAPKGFTEFPKEITLLASRPDGKPAAGAAVSTFMFVRDDPAKKDTKRDWELSTPQKLDANGKVVLQREAVHGQLVVRDATAGAMGLIMLSPAKIARGEFRVTLEPEVRVRGTLTCDELTKAGQPLDWTNVYLLRDGVPIASWASKNGQFEFVAPAGRYTLNPYGSEVGSKFVEVVVPANRSEFAVEPIEMKALAFALLRGKPAPEFESVAGWKGAPVKLSDLKGKYVLVEFWGYWCGPCVGSMPVLIELYEKYADKGLAIVGVHMDIDGEVDTAAKLDAKLATVRKDLWNGKDTPFPSALVPGTRVGTGDDKRPGGTIARYGVQSYPTTILIDREGKVVGKFHARDIKHASAEVEKLLADKK